MREHRTKHSQICFLMLFCLTTLTFFLPSYSYYWHVYGGSVTINESLSLFQQDRFLCFRWSRAVIDPAFILCQPTDWNSSAFLCVAPILDNTTRGVGGLAVCWTENQTVGDLAAACQAPVSRQFLGFDLNSVQFLVSSVQGCLFSAALSPTLSLGSYDSIPFSLANDTFANLAIQWEGVYNQTVPRLLSGAPFLVLAGRQPLNLLDDSLEYGVNLLFVGALLMALYTWLLRKCWLFRHYSQYALVVWTTIWILLQLLFIQLLVPVTENASH